MEEETKAKLKTILKKWLDKLLHFLWQLLLAIGLALVLGLGGCADQVDAPSKESSDDTKISIRIKDLTSPQIIVENEYLLNQGDEFNLQNHVKVIDNLDGEIGYECEGSFDTSKSGQYILLLTAKDAAGNSRDYLYTDGYSMTSASEACSRDLHTSKRSGRCDPIMNKEGIYIGVHLELY